MKLDDLARATAELDATHFQADYPYSALVFLSTFVRPQGNVLDTLSGVTIADVRAAEAAAAQPSSEALTQVRQVGKASLVLFLKPRFSPEEGITLGRALGNDYCLPKPSVSKSHATFSRRGKRWTLTDLGSSNGTFVDANRVPSGGSVKLNDGAIVGLGPDTQAKFFTPLALHGFLSLYRNGLLG